MEHHPTLPNLDFNNTEFAFSYKSDDELKRTYRLFKKIDSPFLNRIGPPMVTLALRMGMPVQGMIKNTIFDVFVGGTSLEDTKDRSEELYRFGVETILDYSVEGEKSEQGFDATRDEILRTLDYGGRNEAVAFSAMKVTGICAFDLLAKLDAGATLTVAENAAKQRAIARLDAICAKAFEVGEPVFIDAEESWIQDTIDAWAEQMMEKYNKARALVYHTIQHYRHDRLDYLRGLIERSKAKGYVLGVKLVRGAYLEKENNRAAEMGYPTPIQPNKEATDRDYDAGLELCLENIAHVALCAGTHNAKSSFLLARLMHAQNIPTNHPHVLFAQLLGMSDNISFNLAHAGYRVAKYVPYGPVKAVMPYLFRRAAENTSIAGQTGRELRLLRTEMRRRGLL